MSWTEESVLRKLQSNHDFYDLSKEFSGKFLLTYSIGGNTILLSNTVGSYAEVYLIPPFNKNTIGEACDFAIIAKQILKDKINNQYNIK